MRTDLKHAVGRHAERPLKNLVPTTHLPEKRGEIMPRHTSNPQFAPGAFEAPVTDCSPGEAILALAFHAALAGTQPPYANPRTTPLWRITRLRFSSPCTLFWMISFRLLLFVDSRPVGDGMDDGMPVISTRDQVLAIRAVSSRASLRSWKRGEIWTS